MATSDRFDTQHDLSQVDMEQQLHEALTSLQETQRELNELHSRQLRINVADECAKGRVPDLIKGLSNFTGKSKQLNTWVQSVDRILDFYKNLEATPLFPLWLQEIRNKICGEAGDLLASNGPPLLLSAIKSQLTLYYGDKREMSTFLQNLFSLKQNRQNINEYYAQVQDVFTGLSTHIQMSEEYYADPNYRTRISEYKSYS